MFSLLLSIAISAILPDKKAGPTFLSLNAFNDTFSVFEASFSDGFSPPFDAASALHKGCLHSPSHFYKHSTDGASFRSPLSKSALAL